MRRHFAIYECKFNRLFSTEETRERWEKREGGEEERARKERSMHNLDLIINECTAHTKK